MLSAFLIHAQIFPASNESSAPIPSEEAAESFIQKCAEIETFAAEADTDSAKTTRFTEKEVNSYLTLHADSKYKSCFEFFRISFEEDILQGLASIDFDCVKKTSNGTLPTLITRLVSGTHVVTARGGIISENGKGQLHLHEIRFDEVMLPSFLVGQMISASCMRQETPFDPMESTALPYKIQKVAIHSGYVTVVQKMDL